MTTLGEWIASGCPGSFTRTRNKGKYRKDKYVIRLLRTAYMTPEPLYQVIHILPDGSMYLEVWSIDMACSFMHATLASEGVVHDEKAR